MDDVDAVYMAAVQTLTGWWLADDGLADAEAEAVLRGGLLPGLRWRPRRPDRLPLFPAEARYDAEPDRVALAGTKISQAIGDNLAPADLAARDSFSRLFAGAVMSDPSVRKARAEIEASGRGTAAKRRPTRGSRRGRRPAPAGLRNL